MTNSQSGRGHVARCRRSPRVLSRAFVVIAAGAIGATRPVTADRMIIGAETFDKVEVTGFADGLVRYRARGGETAFVHTEDHTL